MKNIRYIDKKDVENLIESKKRLDDVIIFLSSPLSQKNTIVSAADKGCYCCQWFCTISIKS